ncbi:MAG: FAD-dependent oxidoreductase [Phaeodactylibacter sp.]|nr:FAD-dependent oxidoreductase [Phaeodactylibacter sp.]MCB0616346.1 FAD-dependent oxidoreductase [Phaeodactylibacter sp.]
MTDVIIIGGGLAGLTAANYLQKQGLSFLLLESADRVGGRVRTTSKEGFLLDHGFQVFATAYPEARALLDYQKLDLRAFLPGAMLLQADGRRDRIGDPLRDWSSLIPTLMAKAGSWGSKLKILKLRNRLKSQSISTIFAAREQPTMEALREKYGFDEQLIQRFFQPFYSGIFLEKELHTSRRMFDFVFKMFAEGEVAVPNAGMQAIPQQLADHLPPGSIRLNSPVERVNGGTVYTREGEVLEAKYILLATEATGLAQQYYHQVNKQYVSTAHVHFAAAEAPLDRPLIALNTLPDSLINNICVMNKVADGYAPDGQNLISVSIVGKAGRGGEELAKAIKEEARRWFGGQVDTWRLLNIRNVAYALPAQQQVRHDINPDALQLNEQLFICGDHLLNGSINAAMRSGRLAAEAIGMVAA